jgi:anthranilate phosphoribosyltransferase
MWVLNDFGTQRRSRIKPHRNAKQPRWLLSASALQEGIKAVAIGKHGVKPVPMSIYEGLKQELETVERQLQTFRSQRTASPSIVPVQMPDIELVAQRASFLASLFLKHELLPAEGSLLVDHVIYKNASMQLGRERVGCYASDILQTLCPNLLPESRAFSLAMRLLSAENLTAEEAEELAKIVLCCNPETLDSPRSDFADVVSFRALTMHAMRVRHETSDELLGMARAANQLTSPAFQTGYRTPTTNPRARYVQLAEPFDGFERPGCFLMTPIIAWHLQQRWGMAHVVGAVSDSPGPKFGPNLKTVAEQLYECSGPGQHALRFAQNLGEIFSPKPLDARLFVLVDQARICPPLHDLASLRRSIVKRPGWSTVEKFVGCIPEQCSLLIASAFHPPYTQRMIEVTMGLKLPGAMIIRKGIEGTLSIPPDSTGAEIACCARRADGTYELIEMKVKPRLSSDEMRRTSSAQIVKPLTALENARLLANYYQSQSSCGHPFFDAIIHATLECIDHGMSWLMDRVGDEVVRVEE